MMSLLFAVLVTFASGTLLAFVIWRWGESTRQQGYLEAQGDAGKQREKDTADVMQRQDELAAIAAQRPPDADVADSLRNGKF